VKRFFKPAFFVVCLTRFFELLAIDEGVQVLQFDQRFKAPWLVGPILSPSAYVIPQGHADIQPYFYYNIINGVYDSSWQIRKIKNIQEAIFILPVKVGLGGNFEVGMAPGFVGRYSQGQSSYNLTDWTASVGYQLLFSKLKDPWPAIKAVFRTTFPVGKYQHLRAKKLKTDATGEGSYRPALGLVFGKLIHIYNNHWLELRLVSFYNFLQPVKVKGYNVFGGTYNTNAKVFVGDILTVDFAVQYSLTQRWALAIDVFYRHQNRTFYKGYQGTIELSKQALNHPSNETLSLAPALEYSFSPKLGLVGGCWFSVAGRNSLQFRTSVISFNVYM